MTAPRRLVLIPLGDEGPVVLAEPPAAAVHAELQRLMAIHPGRKIAAEFWTGRVWQVWIIGVGGERDPEFWSKEKE